MFHHSASLRFKQFWLNHAWVGTVLVFVVAALVFTVITATPSFKDPDSFYHLKMAELMMKRREAVTAFPWLQFTTLGKSYADHHLLYHIALVPFIVLFGNVIGIKVATVLLAASVIMLCYTLLRSFHVRWALVWSMVLIASPGLLFRLSLAKASSVALLFLIGGWWCITTRRYRLLGLISFFYVWAHGGFPLLTAAAVITAVVTLLHRLLIEEQRIDRRLLLHAVAPVGVVVFGTVLGMVIHPSFPNHLTFYWQQIVEIGALNYHTIIGVGQEWLPRPLHELVADEALIVALVIISIVTGIATFKKQRPASLSAGVLAIGFLLLTLKAQRYIEYFIPWAVIASSMVLYYSGALDRLQQLPTRARQWWHSTVLAQTTIILGSLIILSTIIGPGAVSVVKTWRSHQNGIPITRYAAATDWLKQHSTKGDVVFHSDWDDFPILFYNVERTRYIVGLDPTFLYRRNEELYWKWVNITLGEQTERVFETIKQDFKARFVFIEQDHVAIKQVVEKDPRFIKAYEDSEAIIYRIPRQ